MAQAGPPLEVLLRRLVDTPPDFLDPPRIGSKGQVHVAAVVNDLLARFGPRAAPAVLARFGTGVPASDGNRLALVLVAAWLLAHEWFVGAKLAPSAIQRVLEEAMAELAQVTPAAKFVSDPDRREELARTVLARLDRLPEGETQAQASDRLSRISGVERQRLLAASRAAQERAQAIRERLARKAADESADKWTRE